MCPLGSDIIWRVPKSFSSIRRRYGIKGRGRIEHWVHTSEANSRNSRTILCKRIVCYAVLCCAVPCRAVLCYAMLCYAMLCLIFPLSVFSQVFIFQSLILSHFESLIIIIWHCLFSSSSTIELYRDRDTDHGGHLTEFHRQSEAAYITDQCVGQSGHIIAFSSVNMDCYTC